MASSWKSIDFDKNKENHETVVENYSKGFISQINKLKSFFLLKKEIFLAIFKHYVHISIWCMWQKASCRIHTNFGSIFKTNQRVRVYSRCPIKMYFASPSISSFLPESKVNKMRHSVLSSQVWRLTHTLISVVCKKERWKMRHFAAWHVMHSLIVNDPLTLNNLPAITK